MKSKSLKIALGLGEHIVGKTPRGRVLSVVFVDLSRILRDERVVIFILYIRCKSQFDREVERG